MRYFVESIKIEGFRGINNEGDPLHLKFKPECVNSIYAVNATGKSSIFEALCYAIRGNVPKLQELQANEKPDEYVCNRFHSQGKATVDFKFKPDDGSTPSVSIRVQRDSAGNRTVSSPSGYADPQALLDSLNEDFTLLDYKTFQNFIDSTPLNRGRSFAALLGLSRYSNFTQALRSVAETRAINADLGLTTLKATLEGSESASKTALNRLGSAYEKLTGKQIADVSNLDSYVSDVLAALAGIALIGGEIKGKSLDDIDFEALRSKVKAEEGGEKRQELETVIKSAERLKALGAPDAETGSQQNELEKLVDEKNALLEKTRGQLFERLYDTADEILKNGQWDEPKKCPLCESGLESGIAGIVSEKRSQYEAVQEKLDQIKAKFGESTWPKRLSSLEGAPDLKIGEEEKNYSKLAARVNDGSVSGGDIDNSRNALEKAEKSLGEALAAAIKRKDELEKELPPSLVALTEQIAAATQFQEALAEYKAQLASQDAVNRQISTIEGWQAFINSAAKVFGDAESDLSQRKITEIDADYKKMFRSIMGVDDVVPELYRPDHKQDLHVHLKKFHGLSDLSARALLSESFRNALAISVFLSAAMKNGGPPRFVVFDDVASSFDSGHQWNVMEAIRATLQFSKNPDGLQFIILSHDGLLEKYFDKLNSTTDWHHQKLQGMPPMNAVTTNLQDADRLKQTAMNFLDAGQVTEAEPWLRQYLEFKLLQVINKVSIPVPLDFAIKDHKKMVGNCLEAIGKAIELHKLAGNLILEAGQINDLDTMHVPALAGNWVSHYETGAGGSLSAAILKSIIQSIDDFADCFKYDKTVGGNVQRVYYSSLSSK